MDTIAKEYAQQKLWDQVDKALTSAHAVMFDGCHLTPQACPVL